MTNAQFNFFFLRKILPQRAKPRQNLDLAKSELEGDQAI